jgi:hypothetical protein
MEDAAFASSLANAAIEGYRKITGVGPRSAKIAAACLSVLKTMPGLHGAAQLERVRLNVKQPAYLKEVERNHDEIMAKGASVCSSIYYLLFSASN